MSLKPKQVHVDQDSRQLSFVGHCKTILCSSWSSGSSRERSWAMASAPDLKVCGVSAGGWALQAWLQEEVGFVVNGENEGGAVW